MTQPPIYLLRQIYYFLLERPEINKKSNIEKIQEFFIELGVSFTMNERHKIQITQLNQQRSSSISSHDLPNFLDEKDFIQWAAQILKQQQAA